MEETQIRSLGQEDPPEESMATHSSILAWRSSWTEEPGRLLCGPWDHKELNTTEAAEHTHTHVNGISSCSIFYNQEKSLFFLISN